MNYEQKLNAAMTANETAKKTAESEAQDALLNNSDFINLQVKVKTITSAKKALASLLSQVNLIKPFVANDGRKFSVNAYSVGIFGEALAELVGVIQGSRSAFTDEMSMQYETITSVPHTELLMANAAIGSPDYYKDGEVNPGTPASGEDSHLLLQSIASRLGVLAIVPSKSVWENLVDKYTAAGNNRAKMLDAAAKLHDKLATEDFVLED